MTGVKISQLPAIASPATSDVFAVVQSGVTYQETVAQLGTIISSNLPANSVTNAMLAQMAAYTIKGNNTGSTANAADIAAGQFPATHTNDSASAGNVGEYISSVIDSGSGISLTTNTAKTVTSINLTAGDWDIFGAVTFLPDSTTTISAISATVSDTDNTFPVSNDTGAISLVATFSTGFLQRLPIATSRVSLASTTTYYLVAASGFAVSTMTASGFIGARRVR